METTVSAPMTTTQLLLELEPVVETNLNRHLSMAKEWFPHEYVPWSDGRNYDGPLDGDAWSVEDSQMSDVARSSLIVNLLTEDNLPSYHHEIATLFGRDAAWGNWVHRWTAEEGRHGIAMRDYLLTSRAVDPDQLERFRMAHMAAGFESDNRHAMLHSVAYVAFQELATRVSHRNTGHSHGDPVGDQLLARVAADENLHMVFYRNLLGAALELDPNQTMRAITDVVTQFAMPGTDIAGFQRKAVEMAIAGVYDIRQHRDDVVAPVLRFWNVFEIEGLNAEGEKARTELADFMAELEKQALRFEDKRDALKARTDNRSPPDVAVETIAGMHFVFVFGPPAVGKMTVGRALAAAHRLTSCLHNHMTDRAAARDLRVRHRRPSAAWSTAFRRHGSSRRPSPPTSPAWCSRWSGASTCRGPSPRRRRTSAWSRPRAGGSPSSSCTPGWGERLERNRTELRLAEKRSKRDLDWSRTATWSSWSGSS